MGRLMDTFCRDCNCHRIPPGVTAEIAVQPQEMAAHVRVIECGRCKASVIDHLPKPLTPGQADAIGDMQARYWGNTEKAEQVVTDYGNVFWTPAYAHIRPMILDEIEKARTVLDFGAGPGALLRFLGKTKPQALSRIDYAAVEPTEAFRPALIEACQGVRYRIIDRHLTLDTLDAFPTEADLFIATGTLVYIKPEMVRAFFDRTTFKALIIRDYFGNDGMEPGHIMYNPGFPMFAHPWKSVLAQYRIERDEPSIGGLSDGFNWRAILARHV
jgi:hypothetical protein